ncbi:hypothetical protein [Bradyrhizobium japonicum]|uniref:hypothetical protein n=1 Tax=Bradyrhizobium japonicum TaxID=375 RepID=UPI001B89F261|nr:hypothetical protein [Bradyrhizobium japonicum]MBR0973945.1 hypothetical protein [Bradyrhizobium japonicum]
MIRNGLYALTVELQDGVQGGGNGVLVLRDGTIRGGDSFFYFTGSYVCSGHKWKGEVISQEHTQGLATRPFARKVATIGFSGTYTDLGAESANTALLGNRSIAFRTTLRLLLADGEMPEHDRRSDETLRYKEIGTPVRVCRQ